jgi:hypothetical protein
MIANGSAVAAFVAIVTPALLSVSSMYLVVLSNRVTLLLMCSKWKF